MSLFSPPPHTNLLNKIFGYQVQTSIFGMPIPLVYGQARLPGNVIWLGDWRANPLASQGGKGKSTGGKGGKGGAGSQQYTYSASVQIGLCQGPIRGIGYVWVDKTRLTINSSSETFVIGGDYTPINARYFTRDSGAGYFATYDQTVTDFGAPAPTNLTGTQKVKLHRVDGTPAPGEYSVDPLTGIYNFNPADNGFTAEIDYVWLDPNSGIDGGPTVTASDPSGQLGLALFVGSQGQDPWPYLASNFPAQALGYTSLAHLDKQNLDLGAAGLLPNYGFEVLGLLPFGNGILDADIGDVLEHFMCDPLVGCGFPPDALADLSELKTYCQASNIFTSRVVDAQQPGSAWINDWLTMANCAAVWSEGKLKFRAYGDKTVIGNGVQFNPTTSPVYDLDARDYITPEGGKPISVTRPRVKDAFNSVTVEWINRGNSYQPEPVEERDPWAVNQFGLRPDSPRQLHCIMDSATAQLVANTIVQRNVYIRNTYSFRVSAVKYALLEPMDMVTLTLFEQNFFQIPVRIISITENDNLELDIEAEEFPWGTATPTLFPKQTPAPFGPFYSANPGPTIPVVFYEPEPPAKVTRGDINTLLIGLAGYENWGGCDVFVSTDGGISYIPIGRQTGPSTVGYLTAPLPPVTDPDNTSTLALDMTRSGVELASFTKAQEDAFVPLCVVDQELIAYRDAALTGLNQWALTKMRRAVYDSPLSSHAAGAPFGYFDDAMFAWKFLESNINTTVYFKFPAFNKAGLMGQALEHVKAWPYFIHGERGSYPWATHDDATPIAPNNLYRHPMFGVKQKILTDVNGNITPQFIIDGFGAPNKFTTLTVKPTVVSATVATTGGTIPGNRVVVVGCWAQASDSKFTKMSLISVEVPEGTNTNAITLTVQFADPINDAGWVAISPKPEAGWWGPNVVAIPVGGGATLPALLQAQIQALGDQFITNTGALGLNIDQWAFYWSQVTGMTFSGPQAESIIIALGLTDTTRDTIISLSSFAAAFFAAGMRLPSSYTFTAIGPDPVSPASVLAQLTALGDEFMLATGATGLNPDQWAYYYAQVTGQAINANGFVMLAILTALGLTPATRDTIVSLASFLAEVYNNGIPPLDIENLTTPVPDNEFDHFVVQGRTGYVHGANGGALSAVDPVNGIIYYPGPDLPGNGEWIGRTASCYSMKDPTQPLLICDVTIRAHTTSSLIIEPAAAALLSPGDSVLVRLTRTGGNASRIEDSTLSFFKNFQPDGSIIMGLKPSQYKGKLIITTRGTGAGQVVNVLDNDFTGFDISPDFDIVPDATTEFVCVNSVVDYESDSVAQTFDNFTTPVQLTLNVDNSWRHFFLQVLTANAEGVTSDVGFSPYRLIFQPGFPGPNAFGKPSDTFYVGFGPGGTAIDIPVGGTSTLNIERIPGQMFGWDALANVAGASDIVFDVLRTRTVLGVTTTISIFGAGPKIVIPAGSLLVASGTAFDPANSDILDGDYLQLVVDSVDGTTPGKRATVNLYWQNKPATGAVAQ